MIVNVDREKAARLGLDADEITAEITGLLRAGWPDSVALGFMRAKAQALVDRHAESQWDEVRTICDQLGEQVHGGDPVKKARVQQFNDMFIAELRKRKDAS